MATRFPNVLGAWRRVSYGKAVGGPYQLLEMDCGEGTVGVMKVRRRNVENISHIDLRVRGVCGVVPFPISHPIKMSNGNVT